VTATATVDEYLAELAEQRRQSPHTISNYRRDLTRLLALAGDARPGELQVQQIRRFIAQLHAQGLSGRSLARTPFIPVRTRDVTSSSDCPFRMMLRS